MNRILSCAKSAAIAGVLAVSSVAASAADIQFNFDDSIVLGYPAGYHLSQDGVSLTVTGFSANGNQAALDIDWLLGLGVVEFNRVRVPFLGTITVPELDTRVEGGEYLLFKFSEAVYLTDFDLLDLPFGSNTFLLNGQHTSTQHSLSSNIGPYDTFVFKSTNDAFRVQSISVAKVTPVPEPEAIAMLLAGLGVVGVVVARRKATGF